MTEISDFIHCPKCNEYFVGTISSKSGNIAAAIALRIADAQLRNLLIKTINLAPWEYGQLRRYIMETTGQPKEEVEVISSFMGFPIQCQQFIDGIFLEIKQ